MRPAEMQLLATVESPDVVTSPLGTERGAVVQLEVFDGGAPVGLVNLGDTLALRLAARESGAIARIVRIVVGRTQFRFAPDAGTLHPLAHALPEIVPILRRASGRGPLSVRERVLRKGDRVRLNAFLEPDFVVRDDLGPVVVEVEGALQLRGTDVEIP